MLKMEDTKYIQDKIYSILMNLDMIDDCNSSHVRELSFHDE